MKNWALKRRVTPCFALLIILWSAVLLLTSGCNRQQSELEDVVIITIPGLDGTANSYIAASSGKAVVIDPSRPEEIIAEMEKTNYQFEYIILTHAHFDHIQAVTPVKQKYPDIKILVHPHDMDKLANSDKNLSTSFGTAVIVQEDVTPIQDGDVIEFGRSKLEVIHTPGHTTGSICLKLVNSLFTGDTLLQGGVGRTDFPGGNENDLAASLEKLGRLPGDAVVLPGHGPPTTLNREKNTIRAYLERNN